MDSTEKSGSLRRLGRQAVTDWVDVTISRPVMACIRGKEEIDYVSLKVQEMAHAVPSAYGYEGYAKIVKDCASRRAIIDGCRRLLSKLTMVHAERCDSRRSFQRGKPR